MRFRILDTPTGPFAVREDDAGGLSLEWVSGPSDARLNGGDCDPALREVLTARLMRYFAGEAVDFTDVPLPTSHERAGHDGEEAFSTRCLAVCRAIPRGATRTYAELAEAAGSPGAARAAGQSMRRNPLPIVIPCHRVVGAGDRLGGFAGSDDPRSATVQRKRWLLTVEGALAPALWDYVARAEVRRDRRLETPYHLLPYP